MKIGQENHRYSAGNDFGMMVMNCMKKESLN
jgi:hypothetical protein